MLRSVAEVSVLTGLSKVSIYNKIKLKEFEKYVVKNKGITYISDEGINLIFKGLNFKDVTLNGLNEGLNLQREDVGISVENTDFKEFKLELKELNKDYLNSLKSENEFLKEQLEEKDKQISELHKLIENSQILLKEEQKKSEQQLYLAEHFKEVDNKLQDLREKMEQKRSEKIKLFKIFSKQIYRVFFIKGKIIKLEKKKYFLCPMCGEKLKLPKTEELEIIFIKCSCGCGSFIQVRNGYHIPSKRGIEKVF